MRVLISFIAGLGLACGISQAQTVDDIITKNIEARGGIEKLKTLKTVRQTGKFQIQSFQAGFLQENKRPHMVRQEVTIQGMSEVTAYDGKTGWRVSPFEGRKDPELLSEDDLKGIIEDSDIEGQLVDYKEKGYKAELVGHDPVEGTDCYKIKLTLQNGDIRYYYLDTDTYLELKVETQRMIRGAYQYRETLYGDYEQVDGIYFATALASKEKGDTNEVKVTIDKVEVNVPLANSLFTVPSSTSPPKGGQQ
ncbi:MAG: outer membrane lipoprotein-sorting protein [Acidobacteriaceae bacterium]|nr:outer membrane lipoprotein-sorting protein [Acidobacteriaceae bacterium]